mmetsp:Transcript_3757/g.8202  ORF Transcript_3757/g.8202 Transcript_3757/m.8202 type:complete len:235 (+) Transcript_3757:220-924(+)
MPDAGLLRVLPDARLRPVQEGGLCLVHEGRIDPPRGRLRLHQEGRHPRDICGNIHAHGVVRLVPELCRIDAPAPKGRARAAEPPEHHKTEGGRRRRNNRTKRVRPRRRLSGGVSGGRRHGGDAARALFEANDGTDAAVHRGHQVLSRNHQQGDRHQRSPFLCPFLAHSQILSGRRHGVENRILFLRGERQGRSRRGGRPVEDPGGIRWTRGQPDLRGSPGRETETRGNLRSVRF